MNEENGKAKRGLNWIPVLEQYARVTAVMATAGSLTLHTIGYFSIRFRYQAFGLDPEFSAVDGTFLFEGTKLLLFLLGLLPPLVTISLPVMLPLLILSSHPKIRQGLSGTAKVLGDWFAKVPAAWLGAGCLLWAALVMGIFGRHVVLFEDLVFSELPCSPKWIRSIALHENPVEASLLFGSLISAIVPVFLGARQLLRSPGWKWLGAVLCCLMLAQSMLIPILFGVLVAPGHVDRIAPMADMPQDAEVWHIASDNSRRWFWTRNSKQSLPETILMRNKADSAVLDIMDRRSFYALLDENNICGD